VLQRPQLGWPAIAAPILALTFLLHWSGHFARVEHAVAETRARLLAHDSDSDIVVVGIDARSLQALSEWPWPRRHHARLLQQLRRADPENVFLDIDFSSYSTNPEDDALFEQALLDWSDSPVFLATHFQPLSAADSELTVIRPLPRFARHARLASVYLLPSQDGLVREMSSSWEVAGETLHSIFSYDSTLPPGTPVRIDFSIRDSSFGYISFIDVLNGSIDADALRGKTVYVGATAVELRDVLPVPVYRSLPGVVVQALATETVRDGLLRTPPAWLNFALLGIWTIACAALLRKRTWRKNAIAVACGFTVLAVCTVYLYARERIVLEVVPFAVVLSGMFIAATIKALDQQTWRALAYAVGIRRRDALLKSVVESSTDCIVCIDDRGIVRTANPAASRLFACPAAALIGAPIAEFVPDFAGRPAAGLETLTGGVFERSARTAKGSIFPVEVAVSPIATEDGRLFTAIVRDISERKAQQRALEHQATHDPLTSLPNRTALTAHLDSVLGQASPQQHVALLMLDLCRFKEVNDTLGHDVGDDVLREVARRFSANLDRQVFISRVGGDEFTVVLANVGSREITDALSEELMNSLTTPIDARGIAIEVGVSIGIALYPDHARDAKELLRHADVAMYVSKRHGTPYEYYAREHDQHTVRRLSMMSELRAAIQNSGISLHYQPQVNLHSGRAESVEALVRWQHAMHGSVGPAEFVTLAESTDLIRPLTDWTISQALTDLLSWNIRQVDMRVAVNLSARILQDVDFPARLKELLSAHSIRPQQLELEITESAMMLDPERAKRVVKELHGLGVLISIDDYGTGFSSLGYLRDLQLHALKLDQSFVIDLETRAQNRVIVESTLQMAHALGLQVVAEGIETEWVKNYLQSIGYDVGQGYWFARPMPAEDCIKWAVKFNAAAPQRRAG
jgi:diguanylate cyclase (GGDEF)-like protein/PAS domain S-box-containing protein